MLHPPWTSLPQWHAFYWRMMKLVVALCFCCLLTFVIPLLFFCILHISKIVLCLSIFDQHDTLHDTFQIHSCNIKLSGFILSNHLFFDTCGISKFSLLWRVLHLHRSVDVSSALCFGTLGGYNSRSGISGSNGSSISHRWRNVYGNLSSIKRIAYLHDRKGKNTIERRIRIHLFLNLTVTF